MCWIHVLGCRIFKMKSCPNSKKQQKNFIIELNIWEMEKLGTKICVSIHVATNLNQEMLIHFCECGSTRMTTMEWKYYTGNIHGMIIKIQRNQEVDSMKYKKYRSNYRYNIHKNVNTNTYVTMMQWWNKPCTGEI